ncbi:MAG: hypothetical protein OER87_14350 [Gammaproteobacteria bacterium]|nr:hypothetical protein [Gammaproteobacteria bacterium]
MKDSSSILLDSRRDCQEAAKTLILGSVGRVYILTQKLEPELYNDAEIHDHLTQLAANNRNTDIRIIAHDTRVAANQGHCLIHLAQKLPSFAQIRTTVTPAHRNFRESWLIADDGAYMRIRNPERFQGYYEIDNKLECRAYYDEFIEMWEDCQQDQNTRRLSL